MIRLDNVSKYYIGNNEIALGLRKINLEFTVGEMVAITGESGSGKSTLLNVISGTDTYEEGELYIDGKPTSYYDETDWEHYRRDNIGFIYQEYNLIDSYSVFENVNIALIIKGNTGDNTDKIMDYLDKVGLKEQAKKKASQLSSGQKQRLAIARALAKETDIIVADEPTGNLDSENSKEIIKLLHSIAEDKLIFVVTHNYDEVEPYATRKIRMYDGEVAEDIVLREKRVSKENIKSNVTVTGKDIQKKTKNRIVRKADMLNRKNKPVTFAFILSFMTAIAAAFYILLGSFFSNLDNTTSKTFDSKKFDNKDIKRIIVMKEDGSAFSDDEIKEIEDIGKVDCVDKYDCLNDTFYALEDSEEYQSYYHKKEKVTDEPSYIRPVVLEGNKYMKSVTCIDEGDLAAGTMPEEIYDIAIYSEDDSIIGSTIKIYLGNRLIWGNDLAETECTVTAILKDETEQIYFSEKMGQMLSANPNKYADYLDENNEDFTMGEGYYTICVKVNPETGYEVTESSLLEPEISEENYEEEFEQYVNSTSLDVAVRPIFMINEKLTGNEAIVSNQFMASVFLRDEEFGLPHAYDFYNIASLNVENDIYDSQINNAKNSIDIASRRIFDIEERNINGWYESEEEYEEILYNAQESYDSALAEYEELIELKKSYSTGLVIQNETTLSTTNVIQVSEELFEQQIGYKQSTQIAVYLDDYAYADRVLNVLNSKGYAAASTYRIGALEYDWDLVERKTVSMFISLGSFVVIFFIGVFILGMIMSLGMKDFKILRLLGMERSDLNGINKNSIIVNVAIAVILEFIIIFILCALNVSYIINIVKYYRWYFYLIYIAMLTSFCTLWYVRSKVRVRKMNK